MQGLAVAGIKGEEYEQEWDSDGEEVLGEERHDDNADV